MTAPGILLGCTGDDAAPVPPPTTAAPLTGLRVAGDLDHPAVAIKVSDERGALPQVGVDRADLVIVEPVSVSYTSLLAVFHSDLPERVGPVRSVLPVDAPLLGPIAPVFGNTMGATWAVSYVESVADVDDHGTLRITLTEAYDIDGTRTAPNDVFATPRDLLSLSSFTTPPIPYFSYAADGSSTSAARVGRPGSSLVVRYGPGALVRWDRDESTGSYQRWKQWSGPHSMADGARIRAANVLVLGTDSSRRDAGSMRGGTVPLPDLVGESGPFTVLTGGHSATGTWAKNGVNDPFTFTTEDGSELELAPGTTWIEMPTLSTDVTIR